MTCAFLTVDRYTMVSPTGSSPWIKTILDRRRYVVRRLHIRGNVESNSSFPRYALYPLQTNWKGTQRSMKSSASSEYWEHLMKHIGLVWPPSPITKWHSRNGDGPESLTLLPNWTPTAKNFWKYSPRQVTFVDNRKCWSMIPHGD